MRVCVHIHIYIYIYMHVYIYVQSGATPSTATDMQESSDVVPDNEPLPHYSLREENRLYFHQKSTKSVSACLPLCVSDSLTDSLSLSTGCILIWRVAGLFGGKKELRESCVHVKRILTCPVKEICG